MSDEEYYGRSTEARARRRRSVITFVVVLLLLFFAAWYAMSYIRAEGGSRDAAASTSEPTSTCSLTPAGVEVNVYNATDREGLAGQVARDLRKRGFVVKTVANDPKQIEVTGRGQLRHGAKGVDRARLVSRHVGAFEDHEDERDRTTIDVVLGPDYRHLVSAQRVGSC